MAPPLPGEDWASSYYTMNVRWCALCSRNLQQMGDFQFKVADGHWADFDNDSQAEFLARRNPNADAQVFNLNVQGWSYTMILDPKRTLDLTLTDKSGQANGERPASFSQEDLSESNLGFLPLLPNTCQRNLEEEFREVSSEEPSLSSTRSSFGRLEVDIRMSGYLVQSYINGKSTAIWASSEFRGNSFEEWCCNLLLFSMGKPAK